MRRDIVHPNAGSLKYEIREIVSLAQEIHDLGQAIIWENIGDPIQKGEQVPEWIRGIVRNLIDEPEAWAYCDTAGVPATREFLAQLVNRRGGVQITPNDIIFFNGLGDAVAKVYGFLRREARILGPSPAYSTHSSAEAAHSGYDQVTYELDPYNGWMPDVEEIRNKVRYNDSIAGILVLSPDNPTGAVYPIEILQQIAQIAAEHKLFLITDEIYAHIVYNGFPRQHLSEWIGEVPGLAMRGISKEFPWPGSRCGWLEVLNRSKDANFSAYVDSLLAAKRLEVSSTTLPQMAIPRVIGDSRYPDHLTRREQMFEARATQAMTAFEGCDAVVVNKPSGAFYLTVMFKEGVLNNHQTLAIENLRIRDRIRELTQGVTPDRRFVYYLMGATGIVVVPLTGFQCKRDGFRMTLLESDDERRAWIFKTVRQAIDDFVSS